jgi:hypothetical protein
MPAPIPNLISLRNRATGIEFRRRIEQVRVKLLTGTSRRLVAKLIGEEWALKPSQCWNYVKKAEREIQEVADRNAAAWLAEHICIRRDLRRQAHDQNDLRTALAAADSEAKLLGLYVGKSESAPPRGDDGDEPVIVREVVFELPAHPPAAEVADHPRPGDGPPTSPVP